MYNNNNNTSTPDSNGRKSKSDGSHPVNTMGLSAFLGVLTSGTPHWDGFDWVGECIGCDCGRIVAITWLDDNDDLALEIDEAELYAGIRVPVWDGGAL